MVHSNWQVRGIVVLDVGSTNVKATLFDSSLNEVESRTTASLLGNEPYLNKNLEPAFNFANQSIGDFDRILPVDAIVPCAHGSALALLDANYELTLPIMHYEAEPPASVCKAYQEIEPGFSEVLAPTNPGALTLGRQLLWQEMDFPTQFQHTSTILPLGQYVALRLGGRAVAEVTALGAQTHLWAPLLRGYSQLAKHRGWAGKFAPMARAWDVIGTFNGNSLSGTGAILAGIHDSNANLLRYLKMDDFCLLSTGTWIIAFDTVADVGSLKSEFDQVSNTTVFGDPVACCRFMGGREFEAVAAGADPGLTSFSSASRLVANQTMAKPSFTTSGGPLPQTAGKGEILGDVKDDPIERAGLASIYCAQMTVTALKAMSTSSRIIVDGPFSKNSVFLTCLRQLMDGHEVFTADDQNGTSKGAAMLALMEDGKLPDLPETLISVESSTIPELDSYHQRWLGCFQVGSDSD